MTNTTALTRFSIYEVTGCEPGDPGTLLAKTFDTKEAAIKWVGRTERRSRREGSPRWFSIGACR